MRTQIIERVVDARAGQQRVIYWLRCGHKISVPKDVVDRWPAHYLSALNVGASMNCQFCPDAPPEPIVDTRTVRQLWKDAGEP
jgi:hypothetical protein